MSIQTKEEVYDAEFFPLVSQLVALAEKHDIPLIIQAQINDNRPDEEAFFCSTFILPADSAPSMFAAKRELRAEARVFAFTITSKETKS